MSDQPSHDRKLSEISHLFLSSIREKAGNGAPGPRRIPPRQPRPQNPELTEQEMARMIAEDEEIHRTVREPQSRRPQARAVFAAQFNPGSSGRDRVREYARCLTADGSRIGLIEADASEFRLVIFGSGEPETRPEPRQVESLDPVVMADALDGLAADVDQWILLLPPRVPEARAILRAVPQWVMLCACDHDGIIAAYRLLKGLAESWTSETKKPSLSLALLEAADHPHAERTSQKLARTCADFLNWPLESWTMVQPVAAAWEAEVLVCRPLHDKSQVAAGPQWQVLDEFLSGDLPDDESPAAAETKVWAQRLAPSTKSPHASHTVIPASERDHSHPEPASMTHMTIRPADDNEVIDLPDDGDEAAILAAVLHAQANELVEVPVAPPMCPTARLAVSRDRRIVLIAVARQGLTELPAISYAFRWLLENRGLIAMAMPQLAIDTRQLPQLRLLIDQSDSCTSPLKPILQSAQVTIQSYRRLRWSGKRGLLLEAA